MTNALRILHEIGTSDTDKREKKPHMIRHKNFSDALFYAQFHAKQKLSKDSWMW